MLRDKPFDIVNLGGRWARLYEGDGVKTYLTTPGPVLPPLIDGRALDLEIPLDNGAQPEDKPGTRTVFPTAPADRCFNGERQPIRNISLISTN